MLKSFWKMRAADPGFHMNDVLAVTVSLPEAVYRTPEARRDFEAHLVATLSSGPAVAAVGAVDLQPLGPFRFSGDIQVDGGGHVAPGYEVDKPSVTPGYFGAMGIRLLTGRDFSPQDSASAPAVAIVSQSVAREVWPGQSPLGKRIATGGWSKVPEWLTVVGVVADIRQRGLDQDVKPMIYAPFQQDRSGFIRFASFVVRTSTPGTVVEGVRAEIRRAAPDLPIESTLTMDEAVAKSVAQPRFRMLLLALFAIAATLIATCGIYGLMAYAVTQRRREIGVRMALGADRGDVLRLVLARALRIVVAGLIIGLAGAAGVTRVLQSFLFGVTPTDPIAFTVVTLLLIVVGLMAAWLPARRATRIDPWAALRAE
jgi:predicted permease